MLKGVLHCTAPSFLSYLSLYQQEPKRFNTSKCAFTQSAALTSIDTSLQLQSNQVFSSLYSFHPEKLREHCVRVGATKILATMVSFKSADIGQTHTKIAKCLIKPYFQAPSRSQHGKLEAETATIGAPPVMRDLLKLTKGVVDLPSETVIEKVVGRGIKLFEDAEHCEMALKIFMFNMKITIVSPESYYEGCSTYCTHDNCNKPLLFEKVNWEFPRMVLGVAEANEVLIPLSYKCASGHRCKTIDAAYLSQLPTLVQRVYPYSTNSSTVLNSKCAWSLLTPITLEPVHSFVSLSKRIDFSYRVERYLLYAEQVQSKGVETKFPTPPAEVFKAVAGSNSDSYLCPGTKTLRDVRLSAYKEFKPEIQASMKAVKPGKFIAIDSNYENTKKTRTDSTALTAVLSKEGPDKGKVMAYGVYSGHESHKKSRAMYEGVTSRPGYKEAVHMVSTDDCCQNTSLCKMEGTVIHEVFGAVPRGDVFHKMTLLFDSCSQCALAAEHRLDVSQVFFNDALNVTEFAEQYPQWQYLWDNLDLDGSIKEGAPPDLDEHDLYARKLVALAKCLRREHKEATIGKTEEFCKEFCLDRAIRDVGASYHRYVPRRFRSKEDMLSKLEEYTLKWFGFSTKLLPTGRVAWDFQDWKQSEVHVISPDHELLFRAGTAEIGETSVLILEKQQRESKNPRFLDGDGTLWQRTTEAPFGKSKMFRPGCDGKILGKPGIEKEVLNLAKHIHKGCFNFFSLNHGLEFYIEVGKPVQSGKYKGLVKVETAIGTNELEAKFRVTNMSTALTSSLTDPELECRIELNFLRQNHGVDVKKGFSVPPTEHYWRWTSLGNLSLMITGKRIFTCRNYLEETQHFAAEPHLGYGAYRFYLASNNRRGYVHAVNLATEGFSVQMTKHRFVHISKPVLYKELSPTVELKSPTILKERNRSVETGVASETNVVEKVLKRVYPRKVQTVNQLIPIADAKTHHQQKLIQEVYCKHISGKGVSSATEADFAEVASKVNEKIIDLRSSPQNKEEATRLKRKFPALVTGSGVIDTMKKTGESMNFLATDPPMKKRKNRELRNDEVYPLKAEDLTKGDGIVHKRCVRIMKDMRKNWKRSTCAEGKGFTGKFPKGTTSTKHTKVLLNFGVRRIFEDLRLKSFSYDETEQKFVPVYGEAYTFRSKANNSRHTSKCLGSNLQIVPK